IDGDAVSRMTPASNNPIAPGAWVRLATQKASKGRRIPTNTTSPSRISRAAAATMISPGVNSEPIVHLGSQTPTSDEEPLEPLVAKLQHVARPIWHVVHPLSLPSCEAVGGSRCIVILVIGSMVAVVEALH